MEKRAKTTPRKMVNALGEPRSRPKRSGLGTTTEPLKPKMADQGKITFVRGGGDSAMVARSQIEAGVMRRTKRTREGAHGAGEGGGHQEAHAGRSRATPKRYMAKAPRPAGVSWRR